MEGVVGVGGRGARELYIIHNIFQEDKEPEQEKDHTIQVFVVLLFCVCVCVLFIYFFFCFVLFCFLFFLLSAMWHFKPNNMYGSAKLTDTQYYILLGYRMT